MTPLILTVPQTRNSERRTMQSIASIDLMEKAGIACATQVLDIVQERHFTEIVIFCGTGNNGGDGLVIARQLASASIPGVFSIDVIICQSDDAKFSPEFVENRNRWQQLSSEISLQTEIFDAQKSYHFSANTLIIDAIFGIGLTRKAAGILGEAIQTINASEAFVVAIDIPSGLFCDQHTPIDNPIVMADVTLSIQFWKVVFMLPEAYPFYGDVRIVDIGMVPADDDHLDKEYLMGENIALFLHNANPYAHKGSKGHGLLIAGCDEMPGAAILAATAALRGGIGKLTVHTSGRALNTLPAVLPEAILNPDVNEQHFSNIQWSTLQNNINAIAVGPGIGTHPQTIIGLKNLLDEMQLPLILDADALNMLAENKTWLAYLPKGSILTPHFREFEKLAGPCQDDFDRLSKARNFAQRYDIILILKGHHTLISLPDGQQFFNSTGNEGMATAGSGDTLTGLLLALLAQGYSPTQTALLGVYIHGLAGDLYVCDNSTHSLIASDLPKYFGKAFSSLSNLKTNLKQQ